MHCSVPGKESHVVLHLFGPFDIGPMTLKNRVMLPPHGHFVFSM